MGNKYIDEMEIEDIEIKLLLDAIFYKYGYDFRGYSNAHIKRRIKIKMEEGGFSTISSIQERVLRDTEFTEKFLAAFSINVTEMFRDPSFYYALREEVIPILRTYPFIKIWHAGCASGEEVYSMAILLKEEGMLEKTQIYATDFNAEVLKKAKKGIYPIENIKQDIANYQNSGGKESFSNYYTADDKYVLLDRNLSERIVFSEHNLVADGVFGEMNMIICRNVLIYFNKELQNRVIKLFRESLTPGGFLALGSKESLMNIGVKNSFNEFIRKEKIYRLNMKALDDENV